MSSLKISSRDEYIDFRNKVIDALSDRAFNEAKTDFGNKSKPHTENGIRRDGYRDRWCGSYLLSFINFTHENNDKAFKVELENSKRKLIWFQKINSEPTGRAKALEVFKFLAKVQSVSEEKSFLKFIEFCKDEKFEHKVFNISFFDYYDAIANITAYLINSGNDTSSELQSPELNSKQDNKNKPTGLIIKWKKGNCIVEEGKGKKYLHCPNKNKYISLNSPASLLDWEFHLTEFMGRKHELVQLHEWLDSEPENIIQLIHGEGGVGKTRLAFKFADEAFDKGWQAGQPTKGIEGNWFTGDKGLLLIIDSPEEQIYLVSQFVEVLNDFIDDKNKIKVRLLLISRNLGFLENLTDQARGLINEPLYLEELKEKEEKWAFLESTWESLQGLEKDNFQLERNEKRELSLPVKESDFYHWLEQKNQPSSPLMIAAMAVYLFEGGGKEKFDPLNLKSKEIIRELTLRECRRIRNEVQDYNEQFSDDASKLDYQGVILLKAMAAITDGLNDELLRSLLKDLDQLDLDFSSLDRAQIKQMSIWEENQILPLKPDILAADFLIYSLELWAENRHPEWIFSAIGLERVKTPEADNQILLDNFSRLNRLINDTRFSLQIDWQLNSLGKIIGQDEVLCTWLSDNLTNLKVVPHNFRFFLINALAFSANSTNESLEKAKYAYFFAKYNHDISQYKTAFSAAAMSHSEYSRYFDPGEVDLTEENDHKHMHYFLDATSLAYYLMHEIGDHEEAVSALTRHISNTEHLASINFSIFGLAWANSLYYLASILKDDELSSKDHRINLLKKSISIVFKLCQKDINANILLLADLLFELSQYLLVQKGFNEEGFANILLSLIIYRSYSLDSLDFEIAKRIDLNSYDLMDYYERLNTNITIRVDVNSLHLARNLHGYSRYLRLSSRQDKSYEALDESIEICAQLVKANLTGYGLYFISIILSYSDFSNLKHEYILIAAKAYIEIFSAKYGNTFFDFPEFFSNYLDYLKVENPDDDFTEFETLLEEVLIVKKNLQSHFDSIE